MSLKIELYQEFTEEELKQLLFSVGLKLEDLEVQELKEEALFGDFVFFHNKNVGEYGFKKIYSKYQCLVTPDEVHEKTSLNIVTRDTKGSKNYYTRYKTKHGGKEAFNPVTKTGGRESIKDTKKRLGL